MRMVNEHRQSPREMTICGRAKFVVMEEVGTGPSYLNGDIIGFRFLRVDG